MCAKRILSSSNVASTEQMLTLSDRFVDSGSSGGCDYVPVIYPLQDVVSEDSPVTGKKWKK